MSTELDVNFQTLSEPFIGWALPDPSNRGLVLLNRSFVGFERGQTGIGGARTITVRLRLLVYLSAVLKVSKVLGVSCLFWAKLICELPLNRRPSFKDGRCLLESRSRRQPGVFDGIKAPPKFRCQIRVDEC